MKIVFVFLFNIYTYTVLSAQINLQAGAAVTNFPLYSWHDNNSRLHADISLFYTSGNGLKVDEEPSNIGQGWSLSGGGMITRIQAGEPDDQPAKDINDPTLGVIRYPAGYLYNTHNISEGCPASLAHYPIYQNQNTVYKEKNSVKVDREQDYFAFQIDGRSGQFMLDKAHPNQAQVIGDSKLIVTYVETDMSSDGIRTTISSFTIQDENGLIYRFSKRGLIKLLRTKPCQNVILNAAGNGYTAVYPRQTTYFNSPNEEAMFDDLQIQENPFIVNNWYLSEIEDVLNHQKILFNYTPRNIDTYGGRLLTYTENQPFGRQGKTNVTVSYKRSIAADLSLSQIQFPDGYNVNFGYDANERNDIKGDHALNSITINFGTGLVEKYVLVQTYLGRVIASRPLRLYLSQINRYASDNINYESTSFEYYLNSESGNADDFIAPLYFDFKDCWGYYSGNHDGVDPTGSGGLIGEVLDNLKHLIFHSPQLGVDADNTVSDFNPKVNYAKAGLLKKITNPAGGITIYDYAQNMGSISRPAGSINGAGSVGPYYGGVHVSKITNSSGSSESPDNVTEYNYVTETGESSLWGMELPSIRTTTIDNFKMEGQHVNFGSCSYDFRYAGILNIDHALPPPASMNFGQKIQSFVKDEVKQYCNPYYFVLDFVTNWIQSCSDDAATQNSYVKTVQNLNQRSQNPLPLQFKRVEVRQTPIDAKTGKTVYEFTSPDQFSDGILYGNGDNFYGQFRTARQRSLVWAFGLPRMITNYDENGHKITQTENFYDFSKANVQMPASGFTSCHCEVARSSSKNATDWDAENPGTDYITTEYVSGGPALNVQIYQHYSGRVELTDTYERFFKDDTHYQEKHTSYTYNTTNFNIKRIQTGLSNGDINIKEVYFPSDYNVTGALATLKNNNILNSPVATYVSVIRNGQTQPAYLGSSVTEFSSLPNGDVKPSRIIEGRSVQPVSVFVFDNSNPFNYPNLTTTQFFTYNSDGTLATATDEGNRNSSLIYDYTGHFVIASVKNAVSQDIAYTSFETSSGGNWTITEGSYVDEAYNQAVTGSRSFDFHSNNRLVNTSITKSGLSSQLHYFISYWSKDGSVSLATDGTNTITGPVYSYKGWSLYTNEISNATYVNITGTGKIDELRLYPKGSLMSTATFDPLLGKTSECDANNRITFYSYNNFGELELVQDQDRNAIKTYEYRYKNRTHN